MSYTVTVNSVDTGYPLPNSALYSLGASVVLTDAQYNSIDPTYRAAHLTVTASNPGTVVYSTAHQVQSLHIYNDNANLVVASGTQNPLPCSGYLESSTGVTAFAYDFTAQKWLINADGLYHIYAYSQASAGSVTDGNIQLSFNTGFVQTVAESYLTGLNPVGGTATGLYPFGPKIPLVGLAGTSSAPLIMTAWFPAGASFAIHTRLQFSGSPATPPAITRMAQRITKVA